MRHLAGVLLVQLLYHRSGLRKLYRVGGGRAPCQILRNLFHQ